MIARSYWPNIGVGTLAVDGEQLAFICLSPQSHCSGMFDRQAADMDNSLGHRVALTRTGSGQAETPCPEDKLMRVPAAPLPRNCRTRVGEVCNFCPDPAIIKPASARVSAYDQAWCLSANKLGARRAVRTYFRLVSRLGDGAFWYALMLILAFCDGWRGLAATAHLAVVGAIATLLYRRLKQWIRRPRPFASDLRIRAWIAPLDEFSFPSGHTLHAVAFTCVALAYYPGLAWLLLPFTLSVAASRVVLGMHYPSDVLAASVIGALLAALSLSIIPGGLAA